MPKKLLAILGLLLAFVILLGLGSGAWYFSNTSAPSSSTAEKRFVITRGSSATKIANDLAKEGIIKNALAFKVYTFINGLSGSIPPGEFSLPQNLNLEQLIGYLRKGPTQLWVTIPEGLRREEIAAKVAESLDKDQAFIDEFMSLTEEDEGYLFPETYLFPRDVTAQAVVDRLKATFDQKVDFPITPNQVILASILERETKNAATEGPIVAGILLKRINAGWPMQADATVQFALGKEGAWWPQPTRANYELNHPYNTYKILGLPPTPIASPGLLALKAAANPEESDYWYYIHGIDGKIYYATTLEEHNQNVARYIK